MVSFISVSWSVSCLVSCQYPVQYHGNVSSRMAVSWAFSWAVQFCGQYHGSIIGSILHGGKVTCLSVCLAVYLSVKKKKTDLHKTMVDGWNIGQLVQKTGARGYFLSPITLSARMRTNTKNINGTWKNTCHFGVDPTGQWGHWKLKCCLINAHYNIYSVIKCTCDADKYCMDYLLSTP